MTAYAAAIDEAVRLMARAIKSDAEEGAQAGANAAMTRAILARAGVPDGDFLPIDDTIAVNAFVSAKFRDRFADHLAKRGSVPRAVRVTMIREFAKAIDEGFDRLVERFVERV